MRVTTWLVALALIETLVTPVYPQSLFPDPAQGSIGGGTGDAKDNIFGPELQKLIYDNIGKDQNMILAFTECYGGNKIQNFMDATNAAILSGSEPGNTTVYGGFHRGLAINLKSNVMTDDAFDAAKRAAVKGDTPTKAGTNRKIGGTKSTEILLWAGMPEDPDLRDIADVKHNFENIGGTTFTVLAGKENNAGGSGSKPATKDNLETALKAIGGRIAKDPTNEQFILFVTDHGDEAGERGVKRRIAPNTRASFSVDEPALKDMLRVPTADPDLTLVSETSISIRPQLEHIREIAINGIDIVGGTAGRSFFDVFQESPFIFTNSSIPDEFLYEMSFSSTGLLSELEKSLTLTDNQILIDYGIGDSWELDSIRLSSGEIPRITIPEPSTLMIFSIGVICLIVWSCLSRKRLAVLTLLSRWTLRATHCLDPTT